MSVDIKGARRVADSLHNWAKRQADDDWMKDRADALRDLLEEYFKDMEAEQGGQDEHRDRKPA